MTTPNDQLKQSLRAEPGRPPSASAVDQMPALGAFLNAALANSGRTRAQLAAQLDMDPLLVDGILEGLLPDSEVDDATLVELGLSLELEPNLLRSILGRKLQHAARR